jgi:O-acetyl-ADP-ribose deacetylase (regulator of RNase III)
MKFVKGDLLDAPERYIGHGCNAQGVMGSGVALAIKNKHPNAYLEYVRAIKSWNEQDIAPLGKFVAARSNDKVILNLITQQFFGRDGQRYVNYSAIKKSLLRAIRFIDSYGPLNQERKIAIPKIGAGLGGGDWEEIVKILTEFENDYNFEFVVYSLET